jgi:hypothetical protein
MDARHEFVLDIGLVIGGSSIQPLHVDVNKTETNGEIYEEVMGLPNSPALVLLGLKSPTRIAIETAKVSEIVVDGTTTTCSVTGGLEGDRYTVIGQETLVEEGEMTEDKKNLTIIETPIGYVIRGDFDHAGTAVVHTAGPERSAWRKVQSILHPILIEKGKRDKIWYEKAFNEICDVGSLDSITRLVYIIGPKDRKEVFSEDEEEDTETWADMYK